MPSDEALKAVREIRVPIEEEEAMAEIIDRHMPAYCPHCGVGEGIPHRIGFADLAALLVEAAEMIESGRKETEPKNCWNDSLGYHSKSQALVARLRKAAEEMK